ncbi:electron transfer flavoprotein subunit beta/FixA family protein [Vibrio sinaloensis]|uniref:electron transfer flavoprotein subunit beta/FixA family protein n=1 Tax=Photobacterium sp. (strain ATCC 43367) TaxID=379097 RepID=UPI00205A20F1|nr:electron transfer flavoprotein subunit beta/FixA family protein [Vibrio sinaloensis]UPQ90054.1 electron transfer flavoprotein subunit beta/FixA family protein [Vibrio sinaloensis]
MKILVAIKRVIDPYSKVRVKSDGSGVEQDNAKMVINPFCEIAVEEAVRLKEAGRCQEVVVVSIGAANCQEQLRNALALGADRAIHVDHCQPRTPLGTAKLLAAIIKQEQPQLVLLGKQSIDNDNNQVPQMLAGLMSWPQATFASSLVVEEDSVTVTREIDAGLETLELRLPAVVSTDLRLNEPRYASLPNIMKAKRKPLEVVAADTLVADVESRQQVLSVFAPEPRSRGVRVASVAELIDKLKNEAKVIE